MESYGMQKLLFTMILTLLMISVAVAQAPPPPAGAREGDERAVRPAPPQQPATIPAPSDVAGPPEEAKTTDSGLAYKILEPGEGDERPGETDNVEVHYTGWTTDGQMFDSSVMRGQPVTVPLAQVFDGWREGLQLLRKNEKARLWIPAELAFGDTPQHPGAPAGMIVMDVELRDFTPAPTVEVPSDLDEAPEDARTTESGLAYKVLESGEGDTKPTTSDIVQVHYSGWTSDGEMFDSSVVRGEPAVFPVQGVIPGWAEALQLMTVGDKARFWIPADLAYGDEPSQPGAPAGKLVFDVELKSVQPSPQPPGPGPQQPRPQQQQH